MRINTNMAALNAWRTMTNNGGNLQKSLERLASGYRLNRAADDAAGLAVSEKMNAQIRGLGMATRNTQDAISMVQTAEGGAAKAQEMMQRMRELAVQAGSDTLQDSDRAKLQEEFASLQAEIDRTTDTVTFNGRKLINGEAGDLAKLTNGDEIGSARVTGTLSGAGIYTVDVTQEARQQKLTDAAVDDNNVAVVWDTTSTIDALFDSAADGAFASGDTITFAQDGKSIAVDLNAVKGFTVGQFIDHVNTKAQDAGMAMRLKYNSGIEIESNIKGTYGDVAVAENIAAANATFGFAIANAGTDASLDALATITNAADGTTVATSTYTVKGNVITGNSGALQGVELTVAKSGGTAATLELSQNSLTFQVGANTGEAISTSFGNLTTTNLDIASISIGDRASAGTALTKIDLALSTVSTERAKMGAMQNRLENTISNLQTQSENLTAANSRIRDLDMASEMAQFTKFQILSQASTAMLAQANQITQGVLSLLR